jgi:hypothetical protein
MVVSLLFTDPVSILNLLAALFANADNCQLLVMKPLAPPIAAPNAVPGIWEFSEQSGLGTGIIIISLTKMADSGYPYIVHFFLHKFLRLSAIAERSMPHERSSLLSHNHYRISYLGLGLGQLKKPEKILEANSKLDNLSFWT